MKISDSYKSPLFKARCPEIKLGQDVCNFVNKEFPHYSFTKYGPLIKNHIQKVENPSAINILRNKLFYERPVPVHNKAEYFSDLFEYTGKYHSFNCHESSILSELILKLKGIKNSYTAALLNGTAKIDHVVCFFNRDGSEYDGKIKNNQTIIVDSWAGICDFANNAFKEYEGFWSKYIDVPDFYKDQITGIYSFRNVTDTKLSESDINILSMLHPALKIK